MSRGRELRGTPPWCWRASLSWLSRPVAAALPSSGWQTERLPSRPRTPHSPRSPSCSPSPKTGQEPWSRRFPPKRGRESNQCQRRLLLVPTPLLDAAPSVRAVERAHSQAIATRELPAATAEASQPDMPGKVMAPGTRKSCGTMTKSRCGPSSFPEQRLYRRLRTRGRSPGQSRQGPLALLRTRPVGRVQETSPRCRLFAPRWSTGWPARRRSPYQALFQRAVNTIADAVRNSAKDDSTRSADIRSAVLALEDRVPLESPTCGSVAR